MRQEKQNWHLIVWRELLLALGVLALVFLSFGHQPVLAGPGEAQFRFADGSVPVFCGTGPADGQDAGYDHCDACRIASGVALPAPPEQPEERFALSSGPISNIQPAVIGDDVAIGPGRPRAPPFV
jgi:hypothetical protein